jgi:hypothetical protein
MQTNTLSSELAMSADGSLQQQCAEMGALLGLDAPVSEAVLKAALADTTYAHHLLVSRGSPFMAHLLDHPPVVIVNEAEEFTTSALLMRAGSALARWGKTGFSTVSDEQYRDRLALCQNCPHLKVPPNISTPCTPLPVPAMGKNRCAGSVDAWWRPKPAGRTRLARMRIPNVPD